MRSAAPAPVRNPYALPSTTLPASTFGTWCTQSLGQSPGAVRRQLQSWLEEDHGGGCVTVWPGPHDAPEAAREAVAVIVAKEEFFLCGLHLMAETFRLTSDGAALVASDLSDGVRVKKGDVVLAAHGQPEALLLAERVALNLASRLSGVATTTAAVAGRLAAAAVKAGTVAPALLETRKTTPGLRALEKYATRTGGARNHRHGLDAGAMLKENHIRAAGDLRVALRALKERVPVLTKIEIEVTNLAEFDIALAEGADVVMLDNFAPADVREAVTRRDARAVGPSSGARLPRLEVSGNLDTRDPAEIVSFGVDYVSMGALVHKAPWIDMSLQLYVEGAR